MVAVPTSPAARVALITGAGSGIGRQLAVELTRAGWSVAGVDRCAVGLQGLAHEVADGRRFAWAVADVTEAEPLRAAAAHLADRLGPIDLVVACAGIAGETPAVGMDAPAIARIIGINLIGVSNTIAAVLPAMLARRSGHVVAVSSLASFRGLPGQMGYCASKAGLNALMQSLWLDVRASGIRVTTVCPGHTRTPQATGMYRDEYLQPVEDATREILHAIRQGKRFHAFPRFVAGQLTWMRLLPERVQGWLLDRALRKMKR
jgi:NAD(P)-dependent dehydrogenase (short-subunit alcohol dehydrogenase family)